MSLAGAKKFVLPADLVDGVLSWVRNQFYAGDPKRFFKDRRFLIRLVTWPAKWLDDRRLDLPRQTFEKLVLDILRDAAQHSNQDQIKYYPGYLLHCVQEHFRHHGDEIYEEHKSAREFVGRLMSGLRPVATQAIQDRTIEVLAQVNSVLAQSGKSSRKIAASAKQLSLL